MADVDDTKVGRVGTMCDSLSAVFPADLLSSHYVTCHPLTVKGAARCRNALNVRLVPYKKGKELERTNIFSTVTFCGEPLW